MSDTKRYEIAVYPDGDLFRRSPPVRRLSFVKPARTTLVFPADRYGAIRIGEVAVLKGRAYEALRTAHDNILSIRSLCTKCAFPHETLVGAGLSWPQYFAWWHIKKCGRCLQQNSHKGAA